MDGTRNEPGGLRGEAQALPAAPVSAADLLTPAEAAKRLGLSRVALLKRLRQGALPADAAIRLSSRTIRFIPDKLDAWLSTLREART